MSTARLLTSAGDLPVLSGSLVESLRGNWTGTFTLHSPTAPDEGSPAVLTFTRENGATDVFSGVVRRRGISAGSVALSVTIVGGKGHLLADLPPRDHAPGTDEIPAGLVAKGIADDAGELLAPAVETALDAKTVARWTRAAMPGRDALDLLVDVLGWSWRVQRDGTVWAGLETWPELDVTKFLASVPDDAGATYACDGAPIRPGVTLTTPDGPVRVVEVVYAVAAGSARATVRAASPGDPPPARASREFYLATYAATVQAQDVDGSLVVVPDDPRIGSADSPLRGVAFRLGIPGSLVTLSAGSRVRVRFEGGDPRKVYACDVDQDATATHALALVGDLVVIGWIDVVAPPGGGPCATTFTPYPGPPLTLTAVPISGVVNGPGHKLIKGIAGP
jgi:hypothetical protein